MFVSFVFRDTPMLTAGLGRSFALTGGTSFDMMMMLGWR
jgi:hypothetical protein